MCLGANTKYLVLNITRLNSKELDNQDIETPPTHNILAAHRCDVVSICGNLLYRTMNSDIKPKIILIAEKTQCREKAPHQSWDSSPQSTEVESIYVDHRLANILSSLDY